MNTPTSNRQPASLSRSIACDEHSITAATPPARRSAPSIGWSSVASGVVRRGLDLADPSGAAVAERSEEARRAERRSEHAVDQQSRRRLPARARDADHHELLGGVAREARREHGRRVARVRDRDERDREAFGRRALGEDGGRSGGDRLRDEGAAVVLWPAERGEERPRADLARVVRHRDDLRIVVAGETVVDPRKKLREPHCDLPIRGAMCPIPPYRGNLLVGSSSMGHFLTSTPSCRR